MQLSDFNYDLPRELIAQRPLEQRDASRLLLLERGARSWKDCQFRDLPNLLRGDELLVVNNARVIPARLFGRRRGLTAQAPGRHSKIQREFLRSPIEVLLTRQIEENIWEALVRPGRKIRTGERIVFGNEEIEAEVIGRGEYGVRRLRFSGAEDTHRALERLGHVPLPPYIDRPDEPADRERYQTIFARQNGAVAAPTAGLHFTPQILERLQARGAEVCEITLQVGLGTFQPIRAQEIEHHRMNGEMYEISEAAATQMDRARRERRPILAVGTTVVRALEDAAQKFSRSQAEGRAGFGSSLPLLPGKNTAELFIYPGHTFRVVDQLLTNFHLPKATLLVMVCAFAGRDFLLDAYHHATAEGYRFYSYGDCTLIR
jgi:S-adenosylmethionine:tRNA ribosyltransferase-isomerase